MIHINESWYRLLINIPSDASLRITWISAIIVIYQNPFHLKTNRHSIFIVRRPINFQILWTVLIYIGIFLHFLNVNPFFEMQTTWWMFAKYFVWLSLIFLNICMLCDKLAHTISNIPKQVNSIYKNIAFFRRSQKRRMHSKFFDWQHS